MESVDASMYQDGYELGYANGVSTAEARITELEEECSRLRFREAVEKARAQQLKYGLEYQVECVQTLQTKESEYLVRIAALEQEIEDYVSRLAKYEAAEYDNDCVKESAAYRAEAEIDSRTPQERFNDEHGIDAVRYGRHLVS